MNACSDHCALAMPWLLLLTALAVIPSSVANGQSSISVDEPFRGSTLNNPTQWIALEGGNFTSPEWPCLTAATQPISVSVGTVEACVNQKGADPVADGTGAMRLTRRRLPPEDEYVVAGSLLYTAALGAAEGIDITFSIRMEDGQVADGMSFFLKDGTNSANTIGQAGGALGYGMTHDTSLTTANGNGVPGALFGIGFDKWGNFSWEGVASVDCPLETRGLHNSQGSPPSSAKNKLVLRGPDTSATKNGSAGYCYLAAITVTYSATDFQRVRVVVPPYTPGDQTTVSVYLAPDNAPTILPATPTLTEAITLSATSFKFGFSAATGWSSNNHDLRDLQIRPKGAEITSVLSSATTGSGTGPTSGGTILTITGSDIDAGASVTVDGQPCTDVTVSADGTQLTCTTPPGSLGTKQVVVTNANGGPGFGTFTYINPTPTVSEVSPSAGDPTGGNTVTIIGSGFVVDATASLGGQPCTTPVVLSSTELTCVAPAGVDGTVVDATVTNVGPVSGAGVGLYTYQATANVVVVAVPDPLPPPPVPVSVFKHPLWWLTLVILMLSAARFGRTNRRLAH